MVITCREISSRSAIRNKFLGLHSLETRRLRDVPMVFEITSGMCAVDRATFYSYIHRRHEAIAINGVMT